MFEAISKYAQFDGRASRAEIWLFYLLNALITTALLAIGLISSALSNGNPVPIGVCVLAYVAWSIAILVPGLAVAFRRMHDIDKPAVYLLLCLVPVVGGLIILIFFLTPGTSGPNRFGEDPLGGRGAGGSSWTGGDWIGATRVEQNQPPAGDGPLRLSGFDGSGHVIRATFQPDDAGLRGEGVVIGRDPACRLIISDDTVSRTHARLVAQGRQIMLVDLDSLNRTQINGRDLAPNTPQPLRPGDRLTIGSVELSVSAA